MGLIYCLGASPALSTAVLVFRSAAIVSSLQFIVQILDLDKLERLLGKIYLLVLTFMAGQLLIHAKSFSEEVDFVEGFLRRIQVAFEDF